MFKAKTESVPKVEKNERSKGDLLLSGSVGYLLLLLATPGASQTSLLFYDRGGSYPVKIDFNPKLNGVESYMISDSKITHVAGNRA